MCPKWTLFAALAMIMLVSCQSQLPGSSATQAPGAKAPETQEVKTTSEANLSRGDVFITSQELLVKESYPLQVSLHIKGSMPTPCHLLKVNVSKPDGENKIAIEAYSLVDPNQNCIQVLKAFDETIPLDSYTDGTYTVTLNGEEVGEFTQ
jgi:hypothetical protein